MLSLQEDINFKGIPTVTCECIDSYPNIRSYCNKFGMTETQFHLNATRLMSLLDVYTMPELDAAISVFI